jgi:hypothetical protein
MKSSSSTPHFVLAFPANNFSNGKSNTIVLSDVAGLDWGVTEFEIEGE